jgi:subtilase family serine protease
MLLSNIPAPTIQNSSESTSERESVVTNLPELGATSGRGNSDLVIDYIYASWTSADAGDSKSVNVRIENQGTASTSGSFYWGIYLSTDSTITTNDIELGTWSRSTMSAGYTTPTMYKTVQIPTTITGGRYYVGALADINTQISETNENNNYDDDGRVTIDELPDLTGRSCSAPSTGVVGDYLDSSISLSIENDPGGNYIASSGSFYWAMYLSTDSTITSSDTQVGSDQYKSSISGGSYSSDSLSTSNRIPSSMNPGTYYWGYLLDVRTDVDEQNENNNDYTCNQITVEDDLPDIVADAVGTSTNSVVMGDTISVTYRIENDGNDYTGSFYWELYLSTDRTITTSDIYIDEFSRSSISPGYYASGTQYSVQIPTGINPGYYYLGMIADSRTSVTELDETNNIVADTGRLDVEEQADLVPDNPSGPSSAYTGDTVNLNWRIDNDGDDSSGWFYWKAYLSTDSTITSSDTVLGSSNYASSINGGSYRTGQLSVTIPNSMSSRSYYWGIIVDTSDYVTEGDENNNAISGNSVSITVATPDLQADSLSVDSSTSTICTEELVTVNVGVSNQGNVNAGSHYFEVLFSQTGASNSWISIGHASGRSGVSSYNLQVSGTIPSSMTAGNYFAAVYVDSMYQISESNENNNIYDTSNQQLTVLDCTPDLKPTSLSGPTSVLPGQTVTLSYSFENTGMGEASNFPIDLFLSSNPTIDTSDTHLGAATITNIGASSTISDTLSVTIPSNIGSGCWYYGIIVDMNDVVVELNENDNSLASSNQVCILQPNLRIVSVSNPGPSMLGQSVEISVVIENVGGANAARHQLAIFAEILDPSGHSDYLLETVNITSLSSGSNVEITRTVQLPASPSGSYRIFVIVDDASVISESVESDNEGFGTSFQVTNPTNDLLAKWITGPTTAEPGQTVTLQWEIQNLGVEEASFDVEIWLSENNIWDNNDRLITSYSVSSLGAGASTQDDTQVQLTEDDKGTWWAIVKVDTSDLHQEDEESNNIAISANPLVVSEDAPDPVDETTGGCINPATDGNGTSDAAAARASATQLGVDVESMTIEGCLMDGDNEDWFAVMLHGGKRLGVSIENDGSTITIELLNGTISVDNGTLNSDIVWINLQLTNDDLINTSRIYHIRISKLGTESGGPYTLKIVTVNASEVPDLEPPEKPTFTPLTDWVGGSEVVISWSTVTDNGGSGLSHYQIRWAGGLWSDISTTSTSLNVTSLTDGRHSIEIRAVDIVGNPSDADAMWVRIDRTAPTLSITQLSTQYAGPPVLEVSLQLNDGEGSGISVIEWSWDNLSWQEYPDNGAIIWSNWSDVDLYVKVTDNVGLETISNLTINPPANPNAPDDNTSNAAVNSGGANIGGVAMIVLFAMLLAGLAAIGLYLMFKANMPGEDDEFENEEDGDQASLETSTENSENPPDSEILNQVEQTPALTYVANHEQLPSGGTYDTSTGVTWYFLHDGSRWWMQEDGSFLLDMGPDNNTETVEVTSNQFEGRTENTI